MSPEPIEFDDMLFVDFEASRFTPGPVDPAEQERYLEMLKKHSPGNYAWAMKQRELRAKQPPPE